MGDYRSELNELLPESTPDASTAGIGINVKRLIKLRGRMMALVFFLIAGAGIGAVFYKIPAYYVASADIEFQARAPKVLQRETSQSQREYTNYVNTQIQLLTSYASVSLFTNDEEKRNSVPALVYVPGDAYGYVRAGLSAEQVKHTELVEVRFADTDPRSAEMIVDYVVESYMEFMRGVSSFKGEQVLETLRLDEKRLSEKIAELEEQLRTMGRERGLVINKGNSTAAIDPTSGTETMLNQVRNEWGDARGNMRTIEETLKRAQGIESAYKRNPGSAVYVDDVESKIDLDAAVINLTTEFEDIKQRYLLAKAKYVDGYPVVKQLKTKWILLPRRWTKNAGKCGAPLSADM